MSESFEEIYDRIYPQLHNPCGLWKAATIMEWLDDLITAHNHELEQARDPQRIGGRFERDSFEYAIEQLREFRWQHATNDEDAIPYINGVARAHEHEIEHIRKAEYHRGHEDGQHSMDAEHYAVALKLRRLRFDGDSHANLSKLAYAIYPCATGWTCESCDGLRDELIRLLGGVHDESVPVGEPSDACGADCDCGAGESGRVTYYDELDNERHEVVCELRKVCTELDESVWTWIEDVAIAIGAQDEPNDEYESMLPKITDRLIHLLGGDEPYSNLTRTILEPNLPKSAETAKPESDDGGEVTITADLRERVNTATKTYDDTPWHELDDGSEADHTICHITEGELLRVADHIDEWFKRLCEQQEAVLQKTIDGMVDERDELQDKLDRGRAEYCETCEEAKTTDILRAKLDAIREALDG